MSLIWSANLKFPFFLASDLSLIFCKINFSEISVLDFLKLSHSFLLKLNKPNNLHALLKIFLLLSSPLLALLYRSCIFAMKPGVFKSSNKLSDISRRFSSLESS